MKHTSPALDYLRKLLAKFPNAPAQTLGKMAYRDSPELWPSLNACMLSVRRLFGVQGKMQRKDNDKTLYRKPRTGQWQADIPEALTHFNDWKAVEVDGPLRVLVLSDIHVPYHDKGAVKLAIDYGIERKANCVLLNGDMMDFFGLSMWEKDPRKRDVPGEVRAGRQLLKAIRGAFPKARIIFKEGNHEERWERYLRLKCPELLGLPEFSWEEVYGLEAHNIEHVGDKRPIKIGKLTFIHGHEYRFSISNPVNPARGIFLKAQVHTVAGHFHQSSNHSQKGLDQNVISTWSTGCLCEMHPDYAPLNNWNLGFAFVDVFADGAFQVSNLRIINGKVY